MERRGNLTAAEKKYAEVLALLIEAYEEKHYPIRAASPVEVLMELMSANNLKQKDLASTLGSESIVSEVLSGRRELNRRHIERHGRDSSRIRHSRFVARELGRSN